MAKIVYIDSDQILWHKNPDVPIINIDMHNKISRNGLGHIRQWLVDDLSESEEVYIHVGVFQITIVFSNPESYAAFKLRFSEFCNG